MAMESLSLSINELVRQGDHLKGQNWPLAASPDRKIIQNDSQMTEIVPMINNNRKKSLIVIMFEVKVGEL